MRADMTREFDLRIRCDSEQPRQMVAAAAAAGVKSVLDGWTDDVHVTLVAEYGEAN